MGDVSVSFPPRRYEIRLEYVLLVKYVTLISYREVGSLSQIFIELNMRLQPYLKEINATVKKICKLYNIRYLLTKKVNFLLELK